MKERSLNEYRQSKDFGYKPKQFTEEVCTGQTDKVNEIQQLVKLCPNDSSLGKSFRKMFVNEK